MLLELIAAHLFCLQVSSNGYQSRALGAKNDNIFFFLLKNLGSCWYVDRITKASLDLAMYQRS